MKNIKQFENKVIQGDCIEVMKTMPDNSVDTIITDPPAGISFMGKSWDSNKGGRDKWIEWLTEVMRECYRVAKPGSTALVWAIPRTSHWTATAIENAGWQVKDIIMHIFGSGFPKSTDISKQIDKGHKRKVVGVGDIKRASKSQPMGQGKQGCNDNRNITEPATPEAKLWNGWGTALKPAAEHWIVAMKPNDGTYANNALKWGVSGLNVDGGRIGTKEKLVRPSISRTKDDAIFPLGAGTQIEPKGRFPSNIILDKQAAKMLDEQSGVVKSGGSGNQYKRKLNYNASSYQFVGKGNIDIKPNQGGVSRFFKIIK